MKNKKENSTERSRRYRESLKDDPDKLAAYRRGKRRDSRE
jgi:hypothetical protein